MPRTQNRGERFLSPDEARCLLDEIEKRSPQLWDMTFLSLRTGLRSTEIFKLRGGDIDRKAEVLWLEAKGVNGSKFLLIRIPGKRSGFILSVIRLPLGLPKVEL